MLNQIVLVGRLTNINKLESKEEKTKALITLAVSRSYKNDEGIYETDMIDCLLIGNVADNTCEWCNIGDVIGIKGRIEKVNDNPHPSVVADKVTFLSSKKQERKEEEQGE